MMIKTTIAIVALWSFPLVAQAAGGAVDKVVVFADRAEVTRTDLAACKAGKAAVVFERLPTSVDVRTLRADASGKAKSIGTSARIVPLEENRDERVAKLQEEVRQIDLKLRELNELRQGLGEREGSLGAYGSYFQNLVAEDARNAKPDTGKWAQVLDMLRDERLSAGEKRQKLDFQLRKLSRQRELISRNIVTLAPARVAEGLRVQVAVECNGEANPKVSLSYVVPRATWRPEYDLRFTPNGKAKVGRGSAELTVAAVVQQSTGEDWDKVRLILSTSKPKLGAEAPYPARITIRGYKAGEQKVLVDAMEKRDKLAGPAGAVAAAPKSAELQDRGQSFVLELPRRVTVRSDGRPYWMPVDVTKARAEAKLVTIPKMMPYVYQVVQFKNPAAYPLMAGRIHSYRKGSYVGDTQIEYKAPGEPMEVSLGIDEELKVERKSIDPKNRKAGMLSSTKHLERSWWIQVSNNAASRQTIEVRENIPVSKVEDVEVEILKDKTSKGFKLDKHRGFITWQLPINRGKDKKIELHYTIHLPEDWQVRIR
jgi:uncharacterized protein (TIGR02231 family)